MVFPGNPLEPAGAFIKLEVSSAAPVIPVGGSPASLVRQEGQPWALEKGLLQSPRLSEGFFLLELMSAPLPTWSLLPAHSLSSPFNPPTPSPCSQPWLPHGSGDSWLPPVSLYTPASPFQPLALPLSSAPPEDFSLLSSTCRVKFQLLSLPCEPLTISQASGTSPALPLGCGHLTLPDPLPGMHSPLRDFSFSSSLPGWS